MPILLRYSVQNSTVITHHFLEFGFERKLAHLDPNEWADIFAASGAKYGHPISI